MMWFCPSEVCEIGARLVDGWSVRWSINKVHGSPFISGTGAIPLAARTLSQPRDKTNEIRLPSNIIHRD